MNRSVLIDSPNALDAPCLARESAAMDDMLILHRIDRSRNMARFYALSVEPTLFGDVSLTRRWGRIGTGGRQIVELHEDAGVATIARDRWFARKQRRGYRLVK